MLKELSKYSNLGTIKFFFEFLNLINDSKKEWHIEDIKEYFYNRVIDSRDVHEGAIEMAIKLQLIVTNSENLYHLNDSFSTRLNSEAQMRDQVIIQLFDAFKEDDDFYEIFSSEFLSHDIIYRSLQITYNAFPFKYAGFKQLLIDLEILIIHPTSNISAFIINSRYKKLFDKTVLKEIKKRKIGIEQLKKMMELQQIHGEEAEKFVIKFEHERLDSKKEIDWVAEYVANEGYDVASYDNATDEAYNRFIEVKSYNGPKPYFFWSRNEMEVAKFKGEHYWIYLVNRQEVGDMDYQPTMIRNPYNSILNNEKWNCQEEKLKLQYISNIQIISD